MNEHQNFPNLALPAQGDVAPDLPASSPDPYVEGTTASDQRQRARLLAIPEVYKTTHERLACELAMGMEEPLDIFTAYGLSIDEANALLDHPPFLGLLNRIKGDLRESGLTFKMMAKAQAQELLAHSFEIATDPNASASVRADLIKWTAKMAGFEPPTGKDALDSKGGGGLILNITFAGQQPQQVMAVPQYQNAALTQE